MSINREERRIEVTAFCPATMVEIIDDAAKMEGISRSAFVRRALMREMKYIPMDEEKNTGNACKHNPMSVDSQANEEPGSHADCTDR